MLNFFKNTLGNDFPFEKRLNQEFGLNYGDISSYTYNSMVNPQYYNLQSSLSNLPNISFDQLKVNKTAFPLNTNLNLQLPSLASKGIQQAAKFNSSFIGKNAGAVGVVADIASNILGDKSEYSGTKGNLARGLDTAYDMLSDAAQVIPVYGTAISAGLKVAGLGNQVMGKLGGGTDGMTTLDAVLGSKLF